MCPYYLYKNLKTLQHVSFRKINFNKYSPQNTSIETTRFSIKGTLHLETEY